MVLEVKARKQLSVHLYAMLRVLLFTMLSFSGVARAQKPLQFVPHVGVSWQSTFLWNKASEISSVVPKFNQFPYASEKGIQGFGIDAGGSVMVQAGKSLQTGLRANARSHYDYFYGGFGGIAGTHNTYYLDLSGALLLSFRNKKSRDWIAESGITINQLGKKHHFEVSDLRFQNVNYQYTSFFAGGGYDVAQLGRKSWLHAGTALNYIPKEHSGQPQFRSLNLLLKASVRFR